MSNSVTECQEWRIADINHDNTVGTVDLFSKYVLSSTSSNNGDYFYSRSKTRTWLNGTVLSGFAVEVQNAMKIQNFTSYMYNNSDIQETLSDKVKCPSIDEVGCNPGFDNSYHNIEGTIYPIFGTKQLNPNPLAIYSKPDGKNVGYWTRSTRISTTTDVYTISRDGHCNGTNYGGNIHYIVGCIRF